MIPFVENKWILINFKQYHSFVVDNNKLLSNVDDNLPCPEHEEADTKIIIHVCNTDAQANFIIRCSDTNIAIIMLGHMHNLINDDSNVWLSAGPETIKDILIWLKYMSIWDHLCVEVCQDFTHWLAATLIPRSLRKVN